MEQQALGAQAAQAFLDRIAEQASFNNSYLPAFETKILTYELDTSRCQPVGTVALTSTLPYDDDKFPRSQQTGADMEDTQEIAMGELLNPPAVQAVFAVTPIAPVRRVVTLSEDPGKFPSGINRTQFTL